MATHYCSWDHCMGFPSSEPLHEIESGEELHDICRNEILNGAN
jgi:hypothetical protein